MTRFFPLRIIIGLLLLGCATCVVAEDPYGFWPSEVPATQTLYSSNGLTPSLAQNVAPYASLFPQGQNASQIAAPFDLIERLPPVESSPLHVNVVPYPPLASALVTSSPEAIAPGPVQVEPAPSAEANSKKSDKADEKKEDAEPDIPGDTLPLMIESVVIERAPWYHMETPSWLEPWSGGFEMGLDGSSGNSNTFNIRLGSNAKLKTKLHSLAMDLDYHKNTNDAVETVNRLYLESRYEKLSEVHPWTWFFQETTDYDEFQPWNVRVVASSGFGYRFLDNEITTLIGRLGSGFSQEIGGPDQDCVPEMNFGFEYEHRMTKRQKIKMSAEYFPDVTSFNEYRVTTKAAWEVVLDQEKNLSLKISAMNIYSTPNPGGELNDLDYSFVLLWSF